MARNTLREQLDQEKVDHAETQADIDQTMDVVRRHHDDTHAGVWRYCDNPVCKLVSTLDYEPDARHHL